MKKIIQLSFFVFGAALMGNAFAAIIALDAVDSGWYSGDTGNPSDTGWHIPTNTNYISGLGYRSGTNNFFVFDLSSIGNVSSATLRLDAESVTSSGTYTLYDVTTNIGTLTAGGTGLLSINADLGSGVSYGNTGLSTTDSNTIIDITLNASAISAISSGTGLFAIGGSFNGTGYAFGVSGQGVRQLIVDTAAVPEPSVIALFAAGFLGLGFARRRKA